LAGVLENKNLVVGKEMLVALVSAVVARHMVTHAIDEHALHASGHPHADITEKLVRHWDCLAAEDYAAKQDLLSSQAAIYTAINASPSHKPWRTHIHRFPPHFLPSFLAFRSARSSARSHERNHILTELYVKGFRIGFRLHSEAVKWSFIWPESGTLFNPATMVNESRMLYGGVLRTVQIVMRQPGGHEVLFALSPTITRAESGKEGVVHIVRKVWA
jgi:hypothetical protein